MGNTALMGVYFKQLDRMAQLLLEYKTDIVQQNFNGANTLMFTTAVEQI